MSKKITFKYDSGKVCVNTSANTISSLHDENMNTCYIGDFMKDDESHQIRIKIENMTEIIMVGLAVENEIVDESLGDISKYSYMTIGATYDANDNCPKEDAPECKQGDELLLVYHKNDGMLIIKINDDPPELLFNNIVKQPYIWAAMVCSKDDCIKILDIGLVNNDNNNDNDEKTSKLQVSYNMHFICYR